MIAGGMGPVDPIKTTAGKLFASFYALYCGMAIISAAGVLFAPIFHRFIHTFHVETENEVATRKKLKKNRSKGDVLVFGGGIPPPPMSAACSLYSAAGPASTAARAVAAAEELHPWWRHDFSAIALPSPSFASYCGLLSVSIYTWRPF